MRFFGKLLTYVLCLEFILAPFSNGVLAIQQAKAEDCPSGLVFDQTLNRCLTTNQASQAKSAMSSCMSIGDQAARNDCMVRNAESALASEKNEHQSESSLIKDDGKNSGFAKGMNAASIALPLYITTYLLFKTDALKKKAAGKSAKCSPPSLWLMTAGGVTLMINEVMASMKHQRNLKKMQEHMDSIKGSKQSATNKDQQRIDATEVQSEAFEMLAQQQESTAGVAKQKKTFHAIAATAFGAAAVMGAYEIFSLNRAKVAAATATPETKAAAVAKYIKLKQKYECDLRTDTDLKDDEKFKKELTDKKTKIDDKNTSKEKEKAENKLAKETKEKAKADEKIKKTAETENKNKSKAGSTTGSTVAGSTTGSTVAGSTTGSTSPGSTTGSSIGSSKNVSNEVQDKQISAKENLLKSNPDMQSAQNKINSNQQVLTKSNAYDEAQKNYDQALKNNNPQAAAQYKDYLDKNKSDYLTGEQYGKVRTEINSENQKIRNELLKDSSYKSNEEVLGNRVQNYNKAIASESKDWNADNTLKQQQLELDKLKSTPVGATPDRLKQINEAQKKIDDYQFKKYPTLYETREPKDFLRRTNPQQFKIQFPNGSYEQELREDIELLRNLKYKKSILKQISKADNMDDILLSIHEFNQIDTDYLNPDPQISVSKERNYAYKIFAEIVSLAMVDSVYAQISDKMRAEGVPHEDNTPVDGGNSNVGTSQQVVTPTVVDPYKDEFYLDSEEANVGGETKRVPEKTVKIPSKIPEPGTVNAPPPPADHVDKIVKSFIGSDEKIRAAVKGQEKEFSKIMRSPWTRVAAGTLFGTWNVIMSKHAKKVEEVANERAIGLRKTKKSFETTMGISACTPAERNSVQKPSCYCYTAEGTRNSARANSKICAQMWGSPMQGGQNYLSDSGSGNKVCVTQNQTADPSCSCRATKTCLKASDNLVGLNLSSFKNLSSALAPMDNVNSGNLGAGSINSATLNANAMRLIDSAAKVLDKKSAAETSKMAKDLNNSLIASSAPFAGGFGGGGGDTSSPTNMSPQAAAAELQKELDKAKGLEVTTAGSSETVGGGGDAAPEKLEFGMSTEDLAVQETQIAEVMDKDLDMGNADINKGSDTNIFEVLSNRYQRSGMRRLFDADGKTKADEPASTDINQ